jgi:farnesyl diphosphate synthase
MKKKIKLMTKLFAEIQQSLQQRIDEKLATMLSQLSVPSERLKLAMEYALLSQGKRLRPLLVYLTGQTLNIPLEKLDNIACAVECMHAYSLIHDDLPAMDDDDLRRGKPTCHKAFDEATAILAGDALQALAFRQIFLIDPSLVTFEQKNDIALLLSSACGAEGMVSGQAMDLEYLEQAIPVELLQKIHYLKTGNFLETCIKMAMLTSININTQHQKALHTFGQHLGLAFQIQDDYLDKYGETALLGKPAGSDEQQGKKTYAYFYNKTDLYNLWSNLYQKANNSLESLGGAGDILRELVLYLNLRSG